VLTAEEARQLDRIAIGASRIAPTATAAGLRRTRMRGFGIEFQDYRHYQPGDDPRSIDWTVEARLQQLVIRVSRGDGQLKLHLLVDVSASMSTGTPDKLHAARKIAAALCYIAVERRDAVGVATFTDTVTSHLQPAAGRPQMFRVFETLRAATGGGRSGIDRALTAYGGAVRGGGLVVVLSDFFQPGGALKGLQYLLYRGLTPAVVQIVASEELRPDITEDVELVDIEDPAAAPVVVDASAVAAYAENFARASLELGEFCARHGLPWLRVESSLPFEGHVRACMRAGLMSGAG
jgi:uncharacterized protein (DUF58 family)